MICYIPEGRSWHFQFKDYALIFIYCGSNYGWRLKRSLWNGRNWKHGSATFWKFKIVW